MGPASASTYQPGLTRHRSACPSSRRARPPGADAARDPRPADPGRASDVRRCASWLADHLRGIGLEEVCIVQTPGQPMVHAAWRRAPGRPIYTGVEVGPGGFRKGGRSPPLCCYEK